MFLIDEVNVCTVKLSQNTRAILFWYRFYTRLDLDRWLLLALIGVCVGLIATLLKQSIEALDALRWNRTKSYLRVTSLLCCADSTAVSFH